MNLYHFVPKLPYCLLRAHKEFIFDANHNPADYGENECRGRVATSTDALQCLTSFSHGLRSSCPPSGPRCSAREGLDNNVCSL